MIEEHTIPERWEPLPTCYALVEVKGHASHRGRVERARPAGRDVLRVYPLMYDGSFCEDPVDIPPESVYRITWCTEDRIKEVEPGVSSRRRYWDEQEYQYERRCGDADEDDADDDVDDAEDIL